MNESTLSTVTHKIEPFRLYPNPSSDYINIQGQETIKSVIIKNNLGQSVIQAQGEQKIDVSALTEGVYFICIEISSEREQVIKFVKKVKFYRLLLIKKLNQKVELFLLGSMQDACVV